MNKQPVDSLRSNTDKSWRIVLPKLKAPGPRRSEPEVIEDIRTTPSIFTPVVNALIAVRPNTLRRTILYSVFGALSVLALYYLGFGEVLVGIFFVTSLIRKFPSRRTFILALTCLIGLALIQAIAGGESNIGDNLAVYAFLFLSSGAILAMLEVRRETASQSNFAKTTPKIS